MTVTMHARVKARGHVDSSSVTLWLIGMYEMSSDACIYYTCHLHPYRSRLGIIVITKFRDSNKKKCYSANCGKVQLCDPLALGMA